MRVIMLLSCVLFPAIIFFIFSSLHIPLMSPIALFFFLSPCLPFLSFPLPFCPYFCPPYCFFFVVFFNNCYLYVFQ